ncbi:hypothetical protein L7F22_064792 [Adiantum nelumboides]|nr:hypothetical protein [Adiantum nelumboides]
MELMGIRLRPVNKEQASQVEEDVKEQPQESNEEIIEGMLSETLTQGERVEYNQMLQKFPNLFVKDYINVRGVDIVQHQIELKPESQPRAQKLRRLGVVKEEALLKEVKKLLSAGFIYPVDNSEWVSLVVVTPKKNGKWRVCVDYQPLNEATKRDHFPLPFQDEILNEVAGHEKYTVCDGYSSYFQIRIAKEDQKKTTYITPWGCYGFLGNAFWFDKCTSHFPKKVEEGLQRLNGFGGQLNPDKCHIGEDEAILLGHKISQRGIEVDPAKAKALLELPSPKSIKEVTPFMQKVKYMARPLPPPPPKVLSNAYTLFFDGAFRRATGKAGGELVLVNPGGEVVMKEQVTLDGSTSNNEAEYDVLISGLKIFLAQKIQKVMVKGDALLIVKQILGIWVCKNERLRTKDTSICKLFSQFEEVQLYHTPRKENEDADLLAQQAFSNQDKAHGVIAAIALKDPQYAHVQHWCRSCHNCQVYGNKKLLYGPRQAVITNGPFEKWGIDAMGPLPRTANGKRYILVAIDYMTRFGTPLEIFSDNGPGFRRGLLTKNAVAGLDIEARLNVLVETATRAEKKFGVINPSSSKKSTKEKKMKKKKEKKKKRSPNDISNDDFDTYFDSKANGCSWQSKGQKDIPFSYKGGTLFGRYLSYALQVPLALSSSSFVKGLDQKALSKAKKRKLEWEPLSAVKTKSGIWGTPMKSKGSPNKQMGTGKAIKATPFSKGQSPRVDGVFFMQDAIQSLLDMNRFICNQEAMILILETQRTKEERMNSAGREVQSLQIKVKEVTSEKKAL